MNVSPTGIIAEVSPGQLTVPDAATPMANVLVPAEAEKLPQDMTSINGVANMLDAPIRQQKATARKSLLENFISLQLDRIPPCNTSSAGVNPSDGNLEPLAQFPELPIG